MREREKRRRKDRNTCSVCLERRLALSKDQGAVAMAFIPQTAGAVIRSVRGLLPHRHKSKSKCFLYSTSPTSAYTEEETDATAPFFELDCADDTAVLRVFVPIW